MRNNVIRFLLGLIFLMSSLSACGGGEGNGGPNEISGTIKLATTGEPVFQVSLTLFGSGSGNTFTDATGYYSFSGLQDGIYNIIPSKTGYTFLPPVMTVIIGGKSLTDQNFLAYATQATADLVGITGYQEDLQTVTNTGVGFQKTP
jgi:hypothetical protein